MAIHPRAIIGASIAVLASALLLAACGSSDTASTAATASTTGDGAALTVYSGREEEYMEPVFEAYEKKTGTDLQVRYGDSADLALLVSEEGDRSPADVFVAQSPISQSFLDQQKLLSPLPQAVLDRVPDNLRSADGDWIGIAGRQRVLIYNTDLVKESDLPKSVLELTGAKYRDKVAVAPSNASFQDFVAALDQLEGTETTNEWLKGMAANGAKAYAKNSAIAEAVARGEIPMGLVNHYYVLEIKKDDPSAPVAAYRFPGTDPGSLFLVATASVPTASPDKQQADDLVGFLVSDEGQKLIIGGEGEYPTATGVNPPEGAPSLTKGDYPAYDLTGNTDLKAVAEQIRESGLAQ
ncbi:MAG: extracellular solute-binding protein [Actinobacteria bacterium]|nr:extracellular solute-binding protein [Actinomycetota bacterium]MBM3696917.1 extracellular solute-binding protein [Actinomycetota bacterium]